MTNCEVERTNPHKNEIILCVYSSFLGHEKEKKNKPCNDGRDLIILRNF